MLQFMYKKEQKRQQWKHAPKKGQFRFLLLWFLQGLHALGLWQSQMLHQLVRRRRGLI